ncbi:ferritin-like protein [Streptomyces sp. AK04-3B]|uniref:ferritin-like domain-containing protein n=1 Tax=unclassified Streptomyces TaxID=2593676 RepID=UPI0029BAAD72|nr:ferritin-like protein [Streptomyces sp. AK04-3B]MDX3800647.1 ferritin-like protein [Streptomyces sp. AK04-3B]
MTQALAYESKAIVALMGQPEPQRNGTWLQDALQLAIMLELATIPPYLCGLWSIKDPERDKAVHDAILAIVMDEMSHLGLACNMLTTIGGSPRIAHPDLVPKYPGPLPGGVRPQLSVFLSGLTHTSLDMYCKIERPEDPVAEFEEPSTSIGAFYRAVRQAFKQNPDLIKGHRQVEREMESAHGLGNSLVPLSTPKAVDDAIQVIMEQGEGSHSSPKNRYFGREGELAHYYEFRQILRGKKLVEVPTAPEGWDYQGDPIAMPEAHRMGVVPKGGWAQEPTYLPNAEVQDLLTKFNQRYSELLRRLAKAWQTDDPQAVSDALDEAEARMRSLAGPARSLMHHELPDGSGQTYGPEFLFVPA